MKQKDTNKQKDIQGNREPINKFPGSKDSEWVWGMDLTNLWGSSTSKI